MNKQKLRQLIVNLGVSYDNIGKLNSYTLDNIAENMALDLSVTILELAKELGVNNYGEQVSMYVKQAKKELVNQNYTMKQDVQQDKIMSLSDNDTIIFDNKYELKLNLEQNCIDLYKHVNQENIDDDYNFDDDYIETLYLYLHPNYHTCF